MSAVTTPHMHTAEIGDHPLAYRTSGQGASLVLVHGGFAAELLARLESAAALTGFHRVLYHRQGHGQSPRPHRVRPLTLAEQSADLLGLLDHLTLDTVHLVGHSLGALVALTTVAAHPERVASLSLLEPPVPLSHPSGAAWLESVLPPIERYARGDVLGAVAGFYDVTLQEGWRERMKRLGPGVFDDSVQGAQMAFESDLPGLEWTEGLSAQQVEAIRCPLLLVVGSITRPVFQDAQEVVRGWFPWCEYAEVADADHMGPVSAPDAVAAAVATFVHGAERRGRAAPAGDGTGFATDDPSEG